MKTLLKVTATFAAFTGLGLAGCASGGHGGAGITPPAIYATELGDATMDCPQLTAEIGQLERTIAALRRTQDTGALVGNVSASIQAYQPPPNAFAGALSGLFNGLQQVAANRGAENLNNALSRREILVSQFNVRCV
jgi:hypothetical protein